MIVHCQMDLSNGGWMIKLRSKWEFQSNSKRNWKVQAIWLIPITTEYTNNFLYDTQDVATTTEILKESEFSSE
jgi:hypothetical protein